MAEGTGQAVKSPPREPAGAAENVHRFSGGVQVEKNFAGRARPDLPCAAKLFF